MKSLDFQTACVIFFVSNFCITIVLGVAFAESRARGVRLWIAGLVAQMLSVPLFLLRGSTSDCLTIVLANGLLNLSWSLYWASFDVFFGNRRPQWLYGVPLVVATFIYVGFIDAVRPRVIWGSGLFALQSWIVAATVLNRYKDFRPCIIVTLGAGYVLAGASFALRVVRAVTSTDPMFNPFGPGPLQSAALILIVPSLAACTLGFLLLHRDRVECEVRGLADRDFLTGLYNRRGFEPQFARTLRESAETRDWTSLALIDIDFFKHVNDHHGHAAGDRVLVELAHVLTRELRACDRVARIGGDEFCVLLPRTDRAKAAAVAERLRRAVAGHAWRAVGLATPLTVTIGVASHCGDRTNDGADFMQLADMALLAAKDMARDMVLHADQLVGHSASADV